MLKQVLTIASCGLVAGLGVICFRYCTGNVPTTLLDRAQSAATNPGTIAAPASRLSPTVSARPVAARTQRGHDLPRAVAALGAESAAHALDRLGPLARRGDGVAAFDAFEIAKYCADSDGYRTVLLAMSAASDAVLRAQVEARAQEHLQTCLGTSPAQLGERFADIRTAAESGVAGAAVRLLETGVAGQALDEGASEPAVKLWQTHAVELVRRDALAGDVEALTAMADLLQSGQLLARDPAQALTFQLAAVQLMTAQSPPASAGELQLAQEFTSRYENLVKGEDLDVARRAALDLVASCCAQ